MPENESTYFQGVPTRSVPKQSSGSIDIRSFMSVLKCEGPVVVRMTICSSCNGWTPLISLKGSGLSLKTAIVSLLPGEALDMPVCKCSRETSNPEYDVVAHQARAAQAGGMAKRANDFQVGGSHYKSEIQHWDYVLANEIPYLEAMVIKYLTRWRKKGGAEDVRKAYHFLLKLAEASEINLSPPAAADGSEPGPGYVDQGRGG
jgi:hypothetical protein